MERLGDDARRLLAAAGAGGNYQVSVVTDVWRECVGDSIARAAWPSRLARDGTLHVTTVSSTWAFELERLSPEITERLREALGADAPATLRFAPGMVPEPSADPDATTVTPPEITPAMRAEGESVAAGIGDSDLRALVARAAAASLSGGGSDRGFC
jgi:predicted nucleic acid-binding Zn ribbon protein